MESLWLTPTMTAGMPQGMNRSLTQRSDLPSVDPGSITMDMANHTAAKSPALSIVLRVNGIVSPKIMCPGLSTHWKLKHRTRSFIMKISKKRFGTMMLRFLWQLRV